MGRCPRTDIPVPAASSIGPERYPLTTDTVIYGGLTRCIVCPSPRPGGASMTTVAGDRQEREDVHVPWDLRRHGVGLAPATDRPSRKPASARLPRLTAARAAPVLGFLSIGSPERLLRPPHNLKSRGCITSQTPPRLSGRPSTQTGGRQSRWTRTRAYTVDNRVPN